MTSNWSADYIVGSNTLGNVLLIQDSGALSNASSYLGYEITSSNNSALVTGSGSVWTNGYTLYVGCSGSGNSLTVRNGGLLVNIPGHPPGGAWIGYNSSSRNNTVLIADTGSVWNCNSLAVGYSGSDNRMTITNGARVTAAGSGYSAYASGTNNTVVVTGSGSIWGFAGDLYIGNSGSANSLFILDGGKVTNNFGALGWTGGANYALIADTGSLWSSRSGLRIGFQSAGNCMVISNGARATGEGSLRADNNTVIVTGPGSGWGAGNDFEIGNKGSGNTLLIGDGGWVTNAICNIGGSANSVNNKVVVSGSGSVWSNSSDLTIGFYGGLGNSVIVSNGGKVINRHAYISFLFSSRGSGAFITGTDSVWSNSRDLYVGYSGSSGTLTVSNEAQVISSSAGRIFSSW